jgi:hypothetical protein
MLRKRVLTLQRDTRSMFGTVVLPIYFVVLLFVSLHLIPKGTDVRCAKSSGQ